MKKKILKKKPPPRRRSSLGSKIRKGFTLGAVGIILLFGLFGLFGKNGVLDLVQLQSLHQSLQGENLELLEEKERLHAEIGRLQDKSYVEFLAREQLGLMGPNEIFIILDSPSED